MDDHFDAGGREVLPNKVVDEYELELQDKHVIDDVKAILADKKAANKEQMETYLDFLDKLTSKLDNIILDEQVAGANNYTLKMTRQQVANLFMKLELVYRRKFYGKDE